VRYAVAPRAAGGWIDVSSRRVGGSLIVEVLDNGPGATGVIREGIGLSNTRARLEQLYGRGQSLDTGIAAEGGFRVRLTIPGRLESIDASAHR
jgi:sensor histidine kinase YesM